LQAGGQLRQLLSLSPLKVGQLFALPDRERLILSVRLPGSAGLVNPGHHVRQLLRLGFRHVLAGASQRAAIGERVNRTLARLAGALAHPVAGFLGGAGDVREPLF
jgi:hypothetical protein